ncbi:MAG: phosphoribosylanthranilate isomerase [Acidobacteria bacterium]|nr:phosphoribosylanthranilate isomerase [Acidobacteriota bacterium]
MTLVKVCGITTLEDALQAAEAGADALGFNFWPRSPRYIEPGAAQAIVERLPGNVLTVGVFVDEPAERVKELARGAGMEVAQLHGECEAPQMRWWQALPATAERIRERMEESGAEAFLIDTPAGEMRGGTGRTFDWGLAAGLPGRIVLAGGLGPDNVAAAIKAALPWGVDACSRLEREPGRKDHAKVAAFVRAVRQTEL